MKIIRQTCPQRSAFTLIELLMALAICAVLLVAVTAAMNASFYAYGSAAKSASTQVAARLVVQKVLLMIRTTSLHDAYDPDDSAMTLQAPAKGPVFAVGIALNDRDDRLVRVWWAFNETYENADLGDVWMQIDDSPAEPLLEQVRIQRTEDGNPYLFTLSSRRTRRALVLNKATIDLMLEPNADAELAIETHQGAADPVRLIASTMPRENLR